MPFKFVTSCWQKWKDGVALSWSLSFFILLFWGRISPDSALAGLCVSATPRIISCISTSKIPALRALGCHWLLNYSSGDAGWPSLAERPVYTTVVPTAPRRLSSACVPHVRWLLWGHHFREQPCHVEKGFAVWSSAARGEFMEDEPEHLCFQALVQKERLALSWAGFESSPGLA